MPTLDLTPKAELDLVGIWLYTCENWDADQADKYLDQLASGMKYLLKHPLLGVEYSHIKPGYRRFRVEHHDIFYRPLESQVLVIRVLHEDMDAPKRLLD